jgi:plasmid stabilization system protein ParE
VLLHAKARIVLACADGRRAQQHPAQRHARSRACGEAQPVEVSAAAADDLARLTITHRLPPDTNERVRRSLRALARLPLLGTALEANGWEGFRFVLGPWRWLVIVYDHYEDEDRVLIVTVQDGRSSQSASGRRR